MPPLRNTVRLINGNQCRFPPRQHLGKPRNPQPLGSNEQELQPAIQIVDANLPRSRPVPPRMNALHRKPALLQLCVLIFHERNQRTDHQRSSAPRHPGQLITKGFSRARRHHQQSIPALHHRLANLFLIGAKRSEPKRPVQQFHQRLILTGDNFR